MRSGAGRTGDVMPKGTKAGQMQQFTPEQMKLLSEMMGNVGPDSYLSRLAGGDESMFNEIEAPALRQFQELQGQMGSRFSGMGMGAQKSSGFKNSMGQAGSDFAMQLQAQRQQLQQQAIKDLMGHSQMLLGQRPYERFMIQKPQQQQQGGFGGWGSVGGAALGGLAGMASGNPGMGFKGAQLGSQIGSGFD
jgi:hypothetical protein